MNKYLRIKTVSLVALIMSVVLAAAVFLSGCSLFNNIANQPGTNETQQTNESTVNSTVKEYNTQLANLLPSRADFRWRYNGFAEYGHVMTLVNLTNEENDARYTITGTVDDMSAGESGLPAENFNLAVMYTIKDGAWIQEKSEKMMMDSVSDRVEILRGPLTLNSKWTQDVTGKDGKKYKLESQITDIKDDSGIKTYTVMYKDKSSDYYEKREIKDKIGVISFHKLYTDKDNQKFEIGYALYPEVSGYVAKMELESYLPSLNKELRFNGLAEYAHVGKMTLVSTGDDKAVYEFNGSFEDGSGIPGTFKIQYLFDFVKGTITEKVLENTRTKTAEVNSKIPEHIILKLPIQTGNSWQQEVTLGGGKYLVDSKITSVAYRGRSEYSPELTEFDRLHPLVEVRYLVHNAPGYFNDTYIEQRTFQFGRGMIGFQNLIPGDIGLSGKDLEDKIKVEEALLMHMFGYGISRESP